ncbi:MAG: hypothetical protein IJK87_07585 [Prevotella sp.]|nr:hypothetical protein [Prevotella sp.]
MKKLLTLLLVFSGNSLFAAVPTPKSVYSFYEGMQKLSQARNANEANTITESMKDLFYAVRYSAGSKSGELQPNDFRFFDYDKIYPSHEDDKITTSIYIDRLYSYIFEQKIMSVEYHVSSSESCGARAEVSNKGKKYSQNSLIETYVEKTYVLNHVRKVFQDTIITDVETNTICNFKNGFGKTYFDIKALKREAERYYYQKRYVDAYKCYEKILSINADDGEALYQIAIMTYYKEGCHFYSKRTYHNKGKEYMERAKRSDSHYGVNEKAQNVLFWWRYGGSIS